jgi:hypothetical protein
MSEVIKPPLKILEGLQTFQLFCDRQSGLPALTFHGSFSEHVRTLGRLNAAKSYGVFFAVNQTDGLGRSAGHIRRVRSYFVDIDTIPHPSDKVMTARRLSLLDVPPSAVVLSANGLHAYWYAKPGESLDRHEYSLTNKHLIHRFAGDKAAKDIARVLRVPQFRHHKGNPFLVMVLFENASRLYSAAELREAFPLPELPVRERVVVPAAGRVNVHDDALRNARVWGAVVRGLRDWVPVEGRKHTVLVVAFGVARKYKVERSVAEGDLLPIVASWPIRSSVEAALRSASEWAYGPSADVAHVSGLRTLGVPVPEWYSASRAAGEALADEWRALAEESVVLGGGGGRS